MEFICTKGKIFEFVEKTTCKIGENVILYKVVYG